MRRSILKCNKCKKLYNIKLPKYLGVFMSGNGRNLSKDVAQQRFRCFKCGGKYK